MENKKWLLYSDKEYNEFREEALELLREKTKACIEAYDLSKIQFRGCRLTHCITNEIKSELVPDSKLGNLKDLREKAVQRDNPNDGNSVWAFINNFIRYINKYKSIRKHNCFEKVDENFKIELKEFGSTYGKYIFGGGNNLEFSVQHLCTVLLVIKIITDDFEYIRNLSRASNDEIILDTAFEDIWNTFYEDRDHQAEFLRIKQKKSNKKDKIQPLNLLPFKIKICNFFDYSVSPPPTPCFLANNCAALLPLWKIQI